MRLTAATQGKAKAHETGPQRQECQAGMCTDQRQAGLRRAAAAIDSVHLYQGAGEWVRLSCSVYSYVAHSKIAETRVEMTSHPNSWPSEVNRKKAKYSNRHSAQTTAPLEEKGMREYRQGPAYRKRPSPQAQPCGVPVRGWNLASSPLPPQ